jgi:sulfur-oxidizing protein SoxZ
MSEPSRIRAVLKSGTVEVRMRLVHDMETGLRVGPDGKPVPAWFIQRVGVTHRGRTVFSAQCGPTLSRNPQFAFRFRDARAGDQLVVSWTDSRGESRSDEAVITTG